MRKLFIITILMAATTVVHAKCRNVFVEMGYQPAQVDAKLKEVFNDVFRGPNKVYFEVGDSMGYVSDIKNHDARTEGMSYGMMIAVQFGEKDIFDRLWRWSKKYMQHQSGNREGYFAWSCKTDGTRNADGAASDGELYFITALIFASNRWGDNTGINYKAEAQHILNCIQPKEYTPEPRKGGFPGFGPTTNTQHPTPKKCILSTLRPSSSPLPLMALVTAIPTLRTTSPPSTRYGPSGPTMVEPTCGRSAPRRVASSCIRPHTLLQD